MRIEVELHRRLGMMSRVDELTVFQLLMHKGKADVLFDPPQQMSLRNLIFQAEVVEHLFGTRALSHHDQHASENGDPAQRGKELFFLLPRFCFRSAC